MTGHDVAGNTATLPVTFTSDTTAPSGGSVSYTGGYYTAASVPVTLDDGTDAQSGIDTVSSGSELLQRASATLTAGACGGFGGFTTIATHPGATATDNGVSSGNCYRYRYVVLDNVGNSVTYTSGATVKVDTDAPNAFSLSAPAAGFVGPSATVSATAADTGGSGIAQIEFRYCAGGSCSFASGTTIGSAVPTSGFASQSWDLSSLTDGATYTVVARATDAAGNTTDSATTTVTLDTSPPTTSDNAPAGSQSSAVTVTLSPGDGSGSGVASTSYRVDGGGWQSGTSVDRPGAERPLERRLAHDRLLLRRQRRQHRGGPPRGGDDRHAAAERRAGRPGLRPDRHGLAVRPVAERPGRRSRLRRVPALAARRGHVDDDRHRARPRRGRSRSTRPPSPTGSTTSAR